MKATRLAAFTMFALSAALASSLLAQGGRSGRLYDPSTEKTVQGKVTKVAPVASQRGWSGIHLIVESQDQQYEVHAGPEPYLQQKGFTFAVGDQVEIVGSEILYNGAKTLIAREIKKDGKTLMLRNQQGVPMWSGRLMRQ